MRRPAGARQPIELDNIIDGRLANHDKRRIGQGRLIIWAGRPTSVRIPIQSGRGFRFDVGHHSEMKPAT
jgi:hypothetical protein